MTITTHIRVQRGYFRRRYAERRDVLRPKESERQRWRYRLGWAEWLITELIAYWYAEATGESRQKLESMLFSQPTSDQWMSYVTAGRNRLSTGSPHTRTPFIG